MGGINSGQKDIFEIIRDAYMHASPDVPIYELGIDKKYIDILERWVFIDKIQNRDYPKPRTKDIYSLYKRKFGLTEKTFYQDKIHTEKLFGGLCVINKDYERKLAIESFNMIFSLALSIKDIKGATEALKQKLLLMDMYSKDIEGTERFISDRNFTMVTNIILDGKKVSEKIIDISDLQNLPLKELKALGEMVDYPEADLETMANLIDDLEVKEDGE